jgi:DNA-binding response OmpR family regulator
MGVATKRSSKVRTPTAWQGTALTMRVLFITDPQRTGGWLADAFALDNGSETRVQEVAGSAAGLARLRDEAFDIVLVSHDAAELDALGLIEGYRAGGAEEPILVLGAQSEQEMATLCCEAGADGYVCVNTSTTRSLIWLAARAVQRRELIRENRRLKLAEQQRLQREHEEAQRLLLEQRTLIGNLEAIRLQRRDGSRSFLGKSLKSPVELHLPQPLVDHYRELLRTYVIMGSGNLSDELHRLAKLLAAAGVTSQEAMQLHLHVLEELVQGLGSRSTRHVMTRADLLFIEIVVHLAEEYRQRYQERARGPVQFLLPGFEDELPKTL